MTTIENKLIRWHKDGFPPIDLNANVPALNDLIREVLKLRKDNKEARARIEELEAEIQRVQDGNY